MALVNAVKRYFQGEEIGWARFVSDILSPPMVWGALALPIALRDAPTREQAFTWALVYIVLVCVMPISYIGWMVKKGKITDVHMKVREQRIRPFLVSILFTTIAWWTLRFMGAPPVVPLLALVSLTQLALMALVTLVWQISMHAMSISTASVATAILFGVVPALLTIPLIVLVAMARLKLKRHTPAQILAGAAMGMVTPIVVIMFMT